MRTDIYEDDLKNKGFSLIIGIDEAGRGPLAGPVVASAVALKEYGFVSRIRDSKKLTGRQRQEAFKEIRDKAYVGTGIIEASVIDEKNILQATFLAMRAAVQQLIGELPRQEKEHPDFHKKVYLLVDGNRFLSYLPYAYQTVIKGDQQVFSIACASIVAKVTRDRILDDYDRLYPQYGFKHHKGYPTQRHKNALRQFGPSPIHRKTFRY